MSDTNFQEQAMHVADTLQKAIKTYASFADKNAEREVNKLFDVLVEDLSIADYEPSGKMELAYENFLKNVAHGSETAHKRLPD